MDSANQPGISEQERRRLNLEARRICVELNQKKRASRIISLEAGTELDEARLREEVQYRFKIANPSASENDFELHWQTILDDLSRKRAQNLLAEKMKELCAQTQF